MARNCRRGRIVMSSRASQEGRRRGLEYSANSESVEPSPELLELLELLEVMVMRGSLVGSSTKCSVVRSVADEASSSMSRLRSGCPDWSMLLRNNFILGPFWNDWMQFQSEIDWNRKSVTERLLTNARPMFSSIRLLSSSQHKDAA
jgi:hypothetical protein